MVGLKLPLGSVRYCGCCTEVSRNAFGVELLSSVSGNSAFIEVPAASVSDNGRPAINIEEHIDLR